MSVVKLEENSSKNRSFKKNRDFLEPPSLKHSVSNPNSIKDKHIIDNLLDASQKFECREQLFVIKKVQPLDHHPKSSDLSCSSPAKQYIDRHKYDKSSDGLRGASQLDIIL